MKMWMMRPKDAMSDLATHDRAVAELLRGNVELRRQIAEEQKAKHDAQRALSHLQDAVRDLYYEYLGDSERVES